MPHNERPFGNDTLAIPCYLATGLDDPGFLEWRKDHPDWFVAGTWTRPAANHRRATHGSDQSLKAGFDPSVTPGLHPEASEHAPTIAGPAPGMGKSPAPPLDPDSISLADFYATVAEATRSAAPPTRPAVRPQRQSQSGPQTDEEFRRQNVEDLATIIYNEAGGNGDLAMTAVGSTVWNRMLRNHVAAVSSVWQGYSHGPVHPKDPIAAAALNRARQIADGILSGTTVDPTHGATHYHSPQNMPHEHERTHGDVSGGLETVPGVVSGESINVRNYRPGFALTFQRKPVPERPERDFKFYEQPLGGQRVR